MKTSPIRRAGAFGILFCWLWFSTAAPFLHTHKLLRGERLSARSGAGTACISCQWMACNRSASIPPSPAVIFSQTTAQVFLISRSSAALAPLHLLPSRAPPA